MPSSRLMRKIGGRRCRLRYSRYLSHWQYLNSFLAQQQKITTRTSGVSRQSWFNLDIWGKYMRLHPSAKARADIPGATGTEGLSFVEKSFSPDRDLPHPACVQSSMVQLPSAPYLGTACMYHMGCAGRCLRSCSKAHAARLPVRQTMTRGLSAGISERRVSS